MLVGGARGVTRRTAVDSRRRDTQEPPAAVERSHPGGELQRRKDDVFCDATNEIEQYVGWRHRHGICCRA